MTPPGWSSRVSQCSMTAIPNIFAYSIARRMTFGSETGCPSSEIATAPAATISPISASSRPSIALVVAPTGCTRDFPATAAFFRMYSVTAAQSFTGWVFAIEATAANPPAAAAAGPEAMGSLFSKPGSRRWACMSPKPRRATGPWGLRNSRALRGDGPTDGSYLPVLDQKVGDAIQPLTRIDDTGFADHEPS